MAASRAMMWGGGAGVPLRERDGVWKEDLERDSESALNTSLSWAMAALYASSRVVKVLWLADEAQDQGVVSVKLGSLRVQVDPRHDVTILLDELLRRTRLHELV
eukprot:3363363-Rhodomonas_salina.1